MNDKEWIKQVFFGEIIECYMLADLAKIEGNYDPSNKCGNCNFPLALQIFSCMDFIGWLISEPKNNTDETAKNIESFVSSLFSPTRKMQVQEVTKFAKIFRHGLSHEYFAKASGISRKGKELLSVDLDEEILVLDAGILLEEFRASIKRLRQRVENEPSLGSEIRTRYTEMQNDNSLVTRGIISKSQGQNTVTKSISLNLPTYASNASVAPPSITLPPEAKAKS